MTSLRKGQSRECSIAKGVRMIFRRILGAVMLLVGILGFALSMVAATNAYRLVDNIGGGLETSLVMASQNLDTAKETLFLAKMIIGQVNDGLDTVEEAAIDVSQTISETRPLLNQITQVASHDVPNSVEALQVVMADMAQVAAVIDDTLTTLSDLERMDIPIRLDLGIDYAPEVPLEESVNRAGESLEGIPADLRSIEAYVDVTDSNLETVGQDIVAISNNLDTINDSIAEVEPLLDDYIRAVTELSNSVQQTRVSLSRNLDTAKLVVRILMIWIGLTQVVPLYLGWELVTGQRSIR
jgi:methyl-accepting chemotaxis protein